MRILQSRAGAEGSDGFEYTGDGIHYTFADISADHAAAMSSEESSRYERVLNDIALRYERDVEYSRYLTAKAWHTPETYEAELEKQHGASKAKRLARQMYKTRLTRQEALDLGHALGFTLDEMQQFLLRVFDTDDCLRYTRADDMIEAYCFLTGERIWRSAARLKGRVQGKSLPE